MSRFWRDKRVFYELASIQHPIVGNQPTWFWFDDACKLQPKHGLWLVRSSDASCHVAPDLGPLPWSEALQAASSIEILGHRTTLWEVVDHELLVAQGHLCSDCYGVMFEWSTEHSLLRHSIHKSRVSRGLEAVTILQSMVDPEPFEYIMSLMEEFPGCVVELGVVSRRIGWRRWNLVVWEIREY